MGFWLLVPGVGMGGGTEVVPPQPTYRPLHAALPPIYNPTFTAGPSAYRPGAGVPPTTYRPIQQE